jgi:glyoxylase-like metal-dependent hydrolase (beta-lactamase superfamily II)
MVGDAEVTRIDSASFTLPSEVPSPAWAVPHFVDHVGQVPVAFSALVVRVAGYTAVVDPWLADDAPRSRPDAVEVVDGLLAQLAAVGAAAEDVDVVVNTHVDGIGWNTRPGPEGAGAGWVPTFPRARYLFPAEELAALDRGEQINGGEHLGPLRDAGVLEPAEAPTELAPGLRLDPAPGHNHGHVAVRVERDGALAIYAGHLVLSLAQVDDPAGDVGDSDLATATATRLRILGELAERGGLLLTTLVGGPGGGRVHASEDGGFRLQPLGQD